MDYIGIGNMFCMYFMIKQISLGGFTGTGEAKYNGFSQEYFQKTLKMTLIISLIIERKKVVCS